MGVITYNKLVRDKIPEIIEKNGKQGVIRELEHDEYLEMLNVKLGEELKEYLESDDVEELADLAEVMLAVVKAKGISIKEFESVMAQKRDQRGRFDKEILLESVTQ